MLTVLAVVQAWPLPLHLATHLSGDPHGDSGVYVWNLWVFRHEIFDHASFPLTTREVLAFDGPADLRLHNYTVFSNLLALPMLGWLGVVRTFNLVYLINAALAGIGAFLLARRLIGRVPEAFLAGWLFAWAPFLVARSFGHFSLAAAAALPFFVLALYRAWDTHRVRDALGVGLAFAWAAFSDPYYAVYCLLIGLVFLGTRALDVTMVRRPAHELRGAKNILTVAIGGLAAMIVGIHFMGGGALEIGSLRLSMRTLYTPMLLGSVLVIARIAVSTRLRIATIPIPSRIWIIRSALAGGLVAAVLLAPTLYGLAAQALDGGRPTPAILWRSSAPGIDLLALVMPNPQHAFAPASWAQWLDGLPGGIAENTVSPSWVGLWMLVAGWRLARFRPDRFWAILAIGFGILALGPFVQVGGVNTYIPTPWTALRYLPIVGDARMPTRFSVVMVLALSILAAQALAAIGRRYPRYRRLFLAAAAIGIGLELLPAPRILHEAGVPAIYERIAADPRQVRVLELPTGVRDGLTSLGDFNPIAQYYQTHHGKALVGGYLSRVPPRRREAHLQFPVMAALLDLSEGRRLSALARVRAFERVDEFLEGTDLGYVVIDRARVTPALRDFAIDLFNLTLIERTDDYELYEPGPIRVR